MSEGVVAAVLLAWVAVNLGMHLLMRRVGLETKLQWMFGFVMWAAPFVGAGFTAIHVLQHRRAGAVPDADALPGQVAQAPTAIEGPAGAAFSLLAHLQQVQGVPMLDWSAFAAWAATLPDDDARTRAHAQVQRAWLLHLRDALGEPFVLLEAEGCLLLSAMPAGMARAAAGYVAQSRRRIQQVLQPLARWPAGLQTVVLVLASAADYYQYVAVYYPDDGEFALSGGLFIGGPCPHFVLVQDDLHTIEPVIVHELTHNALHHRDLPRWLDEGMAVSTERRVAGVRWVESSPQEMQARHLAYWTPESLQAFWRGESFQRVDDGNSLSYDLALRLVQQLSRDWPRFVACIEAVQRVDHGASAVQQHFGFDLGAAAAAVLGLSPQAGWSPCIEASAATH